MDALINLERHAEALEKERLRGIRAVERQQRRLKREEKDLQRKLSTLETYKTILGTKKPEHAPKTT